MKDVRLLLVEDDEVFTDIIVMLLRKIGVANIAVAPSLEQGWLEFLRFKPDICLIDIVLVEETKGGVELAKRIRKKEEQVKIIFMTSYFTEENYEEVRSLGPSSFMNKDLSSLKLRQAIELAWSVKEIQDPDKLISTDVKLVVDSKQKSNNYFFKVGDSFKAIDLAEVSCFHADGKMTFARIGARNYPTNVQLKVLETGLSPSFLRCHKKYLVNVDQITSINAKENKVFLGEEIIRIGNAYRKAFLESLNLFK